MDITFSIFTMELYDNVLALWQQCEGVGISGADSRDSIRSYLDRNPGMSFVATDGGNVVGAALAGHDGRRGYIYHLAVHPDYRREGLGRQLADRCLQALKSSGIQKCHILVFNDNAHGIAFWESIGWTTRSDIGVISKFIDPAASSSF